MVFNIKNRRDYKYSYLYTENIAPSPSKRLSQSWLRKKKTRENNI
jgi:hypothetical protein